MKLVTLLHACVGLRWGCAGVDSRLRGNDGVWCVVCGVWCVVCDVWLWGWLCAAMGLAGLWAALLCVCVGLALGDCK